MAPADRLDAAYNAAVRLLAARERSESELRIRLAQKGFDRETVIAAIDHLQGEGLQDDTRFADAFTTAATARDVSSAFIRRRLRGKGVSSEIAAQATATDPEAEADRARSAAARRAKALTRLPPEVARRRLADWLARRGYPSDVVEAIAREEFPEGAD